MDITLQKHFLKNDSYKIKSILSKNKRGCICLCILKNDSKERNVILKIINKDELYNTEIEIAPFIEKANASIIKILSYEHNDDYNILVIEHCIYGNLNMFLKRFGYSQNIIRVLLHNITDAILHLHNQNIIHRDIKPDNILVTLKNDTLVFKLSDFGFACLDVNENSTSNSNQNLYNNYFIKCGTPYYMAPELLKEGLYNKKVDIWSFGICVYEIMNNTKLFKKLKTMQDLKKQITQKYIDKRLKNTCYTYKEILHSMLQTNPFLRTSIYEIKLNITKDVQYTIINKEDFELNVSSKFLEWLKSYS
jgi:serine/threonine-protein kinase ULK/ATG1